MVPSPRRRATVGILGLLLAFGASVEVRAQEATEDPPVTLEVFTRPGCPHCVEGKAFVERELAGRTGVRVVERDVTEDVAAMERLQLLSARAGVRTPGVPTFVVGDRLVVGFDPETAPSRILALLAGARAPDPAPAVCAPESEGHSGCAPEGVEEVPADEVDLPVVGEVSVNRLGLPLFTVVVGLVDGFNPCATWVLLFLLAMLVNLQDRRRMAFIAGTFVVVSGVVYFAFMAAWLTFFMAVGVSQPVRFVLAGLALVLGALNVKDFFAFGKGPSVGIPETAKPGLYARMRKVLRAEHLGAAMAGVVVVAVLVNLVELLCTAGLPALYTAILTSHDLSPWQHYGYLGLYILAYMIDDAILVTIGVVTLSKRKLQERGGRWLKLVSGLTILALGLLLLVRPDWLGL